MLPDAIESTLLANNGALLNEVRGGVAQGI
jgi:hypothetical protein